MPANDPQHVTIEGDGRVVAEAVLRADLEHSVLQATLRVESGQLPPGTRTRLVDAVLDQPEAAASAHFQATLPAGDAEMLDRVRARCSDVEARAAGASCLLTGELPAS